MTERCNICFGSVESREAYRCPHCNNGYHRDHLAAWLLMQSTCPVCRQEMPDNILTDLAPKDQNETERLMKIAKSLDNMEKLAKKLERIKRKQDPKAYKKKRAELLEAQKTEHRPMSLPEKIIPLIIAAAAMWYLIVIFG